MQRERLQATSWYFCTTLRTGCRFLHSTLFSLFQFLRSRQDPAVSSADAPSIIDVLKKNFCMPHSRPWCRSLQYQAPQYFPCPCFCQERIRHHCFLLPPLPMRISLVPLSVLSSPFHRSGLLSDFSFFRTILSTIGFLPNILFFICSNWKASASILPFLSLSFSSNSLILCLSCLFSLSKKEILSFARAYKCSRFRSRTSLCCISFSERDILTVYHGLWRGVWKVTSRGKRKWPDRSGRGK